MTTRITRRRLAASLLLATLPCWFTLPHSEAATDPVVKIQAVLPSYNIIEVPIPGVPFVPPDLLFPSINDSGQVAATGATSGGGVLRGRRPNGSGNFRFQAFRTNAAATVPTPLGALAEGANSSAFAISANGTVAGGSQNDRGSIHAVKFPPGGAPVDLGVLATGGQSLAFGINSGGTVVGQSTDNEDNVRAVRHTPAAGLEAIDKANPTFSVARGINTGGIIVGERGINGPRGFVFDDGNFLDIGTLEGGDFSSAYAVNSASNITGYGTFADNALRHAIFAEFDSALLDLGALPGGNSSIGYSINDTDMVVGESEFGLDRGVPPSRRNHAFLWTSDLGMRDLNSLVKNLGTWELLAATGINNKGQIVGFGFLAERLTVFRLTPEGGETPGRVQLSAAQVRFGMIRVGQHRRRNLIVANIGNGNFSGRIVHADSPFRVVSLGGSTATDANGDFPVSLTGGQRVTLVLEFRPRRRARFRQRLLVTNDDPSFPTLAVRMSGDACGRRGE